MPEATAPEAKEAAPGPAPHLVPLAEGLEAPAAAETAQATGWCTKSWK